MDFYTAGKDYIICTLCPKTCKIKTDGTGDCGIRMNKNNKLFLPYNGIPSALNIDPIEKKPLYHFYPGANIFSIGFYGCNFHCPFCQNHGISQKPFPSGTDSYLPPEELITLVKNRNLSLLAFTYSEPLVHFEYLLDSAKLAQLADIKTVLVTNGYINKVPARELLPYINALNIDLKTINDDFYRTEIGGSLDPVLDFIELSTAYSHVEVTTLIIPGKNDSISEIEEISSFIAAIDRSIPLHLSAYYPTYRYTIPSTPESTIAGSLSAARKYLDYVYPGNTVSMDSNTYCPNCSSLLVKRTGYRTSIQGIENGKCLKCGMKIGIVV